MDAPAKPQRKAKRKAKQPSNRQLMQLRRKPGSGKAWEDTGLSDEQLIERARARIGRILEFVDDKAMAAAPLEQLVKSARSLLEFERLLSNKPTTIVGIEHRMALTKIGPALLTELQRRGVTLDAPKGSYQEITGG